MKEFRPGIQLVEVIPGTGFKLSDALRQAAGPIWSADTWELKKFVAQVISHLSDDFEHILDDEVCTSDPRVFDVRIDYCQQFAEKYSQEFLPVSAMWYRDLFREKLVTIRVSPDLLAAAREAYLSVYDHRGFIDGLMEELSRIHRSRELISELAAVKELEPPACWDRLESVIADLLFKGDVSEEFVWHLLYTRAFRE